MVAEGKHFDAQIYSADITHFFDPAVYAETGIHGAITLAEDLLVWKPYEQDHINKFISMTQIGFYNNQFLDSS